MNAATLLMIPSRATAASARWMVFAFMGLALTLSVSLQWFHLAPADSLVAPLICGYAEAFAGVLFVAPFLLLAIDARQLRIPRAQRPIVAGMILYAALMVLIPSAMLSIANGRVGVITAIQTLGLVIGLTLGLLPRFFSIAAGFTPALLGMLHISVRYPEKTDIAEIWIAITWLISICALCWWRQLHLTDPYNQGFSKPIVLRSRLPDSVRYRNGGTAGANRGTAAQIRSQLDGLRAVANLHHSGPEHVALSLRIALGGWLLPKTWQSAFRQWMALLAPVALFLAFTYARYGTVISSVVSNLWHALSFAGWVWITGFSNVLLGMTSIMLLQQRWLGSNAELSLLALLPRLGDRTTLIRDLLRASLLPTLRWQLLVIALLLAGALALHPDRLNLVIAALTQIIAIAFAPAFALALFGGRAAPPWLPGATSGAGFSLIGIATGVMGGLGNHHRLGSVVAASTITCWLVILAFLVWLGVRGWRGLQTRPHPFLID